MIVEASEQDYENWIIKNFESEKEMDYHFFMQCIKYAHCDKRKIENNKIVVRWTNEMIDMWMPGSPKEHRKYMRHALKQNWLIQIDKDKYVIGEVVNGENVYFYNHMNEMFEGCD